MLELTDAKRRLVERLLRVDSATAGELAADFGLTDTAVRQHLDALVELGFVDRFDGTATGRGRPASRWRLTDAARAFFPDRHGDLVIELIESVRSTLGDQALDAVIDARAARQIDDYRDAVGTGQVPVRVRRLADRRTAEGYHAEAIADGDDWVLVEHHCPICSAATSCTSLCRSELEVFRAALGDDVLVEREQHLLAGDQRCAYRIRPSR